MRSGARLRASAGRIVTSGALVAASAAAPAGTACTNKPAVSFEVTLPPDVAPNTAWIEVGVFAHGACRDLPIQGGIPTDGASARLAFQPSSTPPPLGDLAATTYAFAVLAKGDDCGVVALGCDEYDMSSERDVSIHLSAVGGGGGACAAGSVCQGAQCVPNLDNGDPGVGAGCSMQLLGAGPLGDPLGVSGTLVSAPAIVPTDQGFLLAYREYDTFQGQARLTILPIDVGGGAHKVQTVDLPNRCTGSDESDAVGMAIGLSKGLVSVSRAPCSGGSGGVDLFQTDTNGNVLLSSFTGSPGARVSQSTGHALAFRPSAGDFALAFVQQATARVVTSDGIKINDGATTLTFGGAPPQSAAWVAANDSVLGLVSIASGDPDAGADPASTAVRVQVTSPSTPFTGLPDPVSFMGSWASVAASGGRIVVASDGVQSGRPVAIHVFDQGGGDATVTDGFSTPGGQHVLYADTAASQDHLFFAVERPGTIAVVAYDKASTTPVKLRTVVLSDDPRVPSMATVKDGRVAVAASATRVGIAWTTAKQLGSNDTVGGYAVLACTTP